MNLSMMLATVQDNPYKPFQGLGPFDFEFSCPCDLPSLVMIAGPTPRPLNPKPKPFDSGLSPKLRTRQPSRGVRGALGDTGVFRVRYRLYGAYVGLYTG